MKRVLVSGSRTWADKASVWLRLQQELDHCVEPSPTGALMELVHGHCPSGADQLADRWGRTQPNVIVERHPADWPGFPTRAGMIRNRVMIESGIDVALFFIHDDSPGATGCLRMARKAKVPSIRIMRKYGPW